MQQDHQCRFIETPEALESLCKDLESSLWLAVDTEFLREKTFFPKFCLVQIANDQIAACIDPLKINDLSPLIKLLYNPRILKLFHSGRQDLEIFYNLSGKLPQPIFDTQIAAPLLGLPEQIGYANLVSEISGVNLEKTHTRTDWSHRPLSQAQIQYALDDVIYLAKMYPVIHQKLQEQGRLEWLNDDFKALTDETLYLPDSSKAWQKIKPGSRLKGPSLAIFQQLAEWRENVARSENIPRAWLLKDEVILSLAQLQPDNTEELKQIRGLSKTADKKFGAALCQLIADAKKEKPLPWPKPRRQKTVEEETLIDFLYVIVRLRAAQHTLSPGILASRKDLEEFIQHPTESKLYSGWRKQLIGNTLNAVLEGKNALKCTDGNIQLISQE